MDIKIDEMREEDLEIVTKLSDQLGYPNSLDAVHERFKLICENPNYALFVARDETGKVLGFIQINREIHTLVAAPRAEIAALVVDHTLRNQGIGTALLQKAEAWAKSQGLRLVRLRSNVKRTDAHRFYQRNGYEIPKSWHLFTKYL